MLLTTMTDGLEVLNLFVFTAIYTANNSDIIISFCWKRKRGGSIKKLQEIRKMTEKYLILLFEWWNKTEWLQIYILCYYRIWCLLLQFLFALPFFFAWKLDEMGSIWGSLVRLVATMGRHTNISSENIRNYERFTGNMDYDN